jgi:coiled-coil domain-containing protein 77
MKPEIHALPISEDLLAYYKERIEASEQEYQGFINALESIKISHEEQHGLRWALHKKDIEILELQRSLSETQTFLLEERKQLLRVISDNDELKVQELKDRKKIRYLLSVHGVEAAEKETTYFIPSLAKRYVRREDGKENNNENCISTKIDTKGVSFFDDSVEDEQTLKLRIQALKAEKEEQVREFSNKKETNVRANYFSP